MSQQPDKTQSLARNTFLLTGGQVFSQAATILTLSLLARLVSKDNVATYQQLTLLWGILSPLILGGLPLGLLFFLPRSTNDAERRLWIGTAYALLTISGLIAMLSVVLLRDPTAALLGNNPSLAPALILYSPYLLFSFVAIATPYALIASGRAVAAAVLNGIGGAVLLVGIVGAVLISPTAQALAIGISCAGAVWAWISVLVVKRMIGFRLARGGQARHALRRLLSYGLPLALSAVAARIGYQADRVIVAANFSVTQFAIYAVGAVEIPIALLLQTSVMSVLVPALSGLWREGNVAGMLQLWREATRKSTLVVAPMFGFLFATAPDVIRVLFGPGYGGSVTVFRIYLLLLPLRMTTWGIITFAVGKPRANWPVAVIMVVGNIVLALLLIGPLGLNGPAFAAPVTTLIAAVYYMMWTRAQLGTRIRDMLPFRDSAAAFGLCCVVGAFVQLVQLLPLPSVLRLAIAAAIFVPGCVALLLLSGLITDDDHQRLRAAVLRLLRLRARDEPPRSRSRAVPRNP